MDFIAVLEFLIPFFEREKINFAFIGGFAVQSLGIERATRDVDFLILIEDAPKLRSAMTSRGYEIVADNENVLCFMGKSPALGRVDFLLAHRTHSVGMLKRAEVREGLLGKYRYKVARPEDIIGLKVQAIANSPHRREKDWPDVKKLVSLHRAKMDMALVREYFQIFEMEPELDDFLRTFSDAPHA